MDEDCLYWVEVCCVIGVILCENDVWFDCFGIDCCCYVMDWYYFVLVGVLLLEMGWVWFYVCWNEFVEVGLGC